MSKKSLKNSSTLKKQRIQRVDNFCNLQEEGVYTLILNTERGLELHGPSGNIIPVKQVKSQLYYDRELKPKVLAYSETSCPPFQNASLSLKNYKYLCAIDTNTREVNGRRLSVSVVFLGMWEDAKECTQFNLWPELYIDVFDFEGKSERYAWHKVMNLITKGPNYDGQNTFGIIVDSELGDIPLMNERKTPVYNDYYLPDHMELVYATGDKSGTVQNFMIKKCDQFATARLNLLAESYNSFEKVPKNFENVAKYPEEDENVGEAGGDDEAKGFDPPQQIGGSKPCPFDGDGSGWNI